MLASLTRALVVAAAFAVVCAPLSGMAAEPAPAKPASAKPASAKPAVKKPSGGSSKPKAGTTTKKKPAAKKPKPPPPPPPPPPVELIGYVIMPPGAFRAGPPSGQYDGDGRRAARRASSRSPCRA